MLKMVALLALAVPIAAATACVAGSPSTSEQEATPAKGQRADEPLASSDSALRGGWGRGLRARPTWVWRPGFYPGWVNGEWAPGWSWNRGEWAEGPGAQYTCTTDLDCAGPLGPDVAVCSYNPTVARGYCIAPGWSP